jgi:metallo-beta-lactamase class B
VKDNGKTRTAALYGGTILTPGIISDEGLQTYAKSVAHFKDETKKAKAEIVLANHPLMDPPASKLAKLASRKKGDANPYVVARTTISGSSMSWPDAPRSTSRGASSSVVGGSG